MNVTLRQLRAFVAVARTGSFKLGAESLYISQSALSGLVKELEQGLGLTVVNRSTRRVQLSEMGQTLYPRVEKLLQDLDRLLAEVAEHKALKSGHVAVAAPQLMASTLLPEVMAAYHREHPQVRIQVIDCSVESVVSRVFSGEADLGIGPERDPNSDIEAETLFEGPFMAALPPGHALASQAELRWAELVRHPLITLKGQFTEGLALELRSVLGGPSIVPAHEVAFMPTALAMVGAGLGVAPCISYAAPLVQRHQLVLRPLIDPVLTRGFFVFTRQGRALAPAAQSFRDFLFAFVQAHPEFTQA